MERILIVISVEQTMVLKPRPGFPIRLSFLNLDLFFSYRRGACTLVSCIINFRLQLLPLGLPLAKSLLGERGVWNVMMGKMLASSERKR